MSLHAVNILEINITNSSKKNILEEIQKYLQDGSEKGGKPFIIATPNPEQIVYSHRDEGFKKMLNRADVAIPDGIGLVLARPSEITRAIPGIDFMENLVALAAKERVPVALIGGAKKIAVKALECLFQKYPGLSGTAFEAPEFTIGPSGLSMIGSIDEYFENLVKELKKQHIGMVFVGLGAPKQEYFIEKLSEQYPSLYMSVGGSFDEISGTIPRAPGWVSRVGLKWLWRLVLEPWRIKRQVSLIRFVWLITWEKLFSRG